MMEIIYYLIVIFLGLIVGIISGLLPGLHTNTIAAILTAFYFANPLDANINFYIIFAVSVAVANAFFDIFPSLFLGVPATEAFALVPTHQLSRKGYGKETLKISNYGSLLSFIFSLILCLILCFLIYHYAINILEKIDLFLRKNKLMFWLLFGISSVLILSEEPADKTNISRIKLKISALIIFLLSGIFGLAALGTPLLPHNDSAFSAIFPALTGLFGMSSLFLSLVEKDEKLSEQKEPEQEKFAYTNGASLGFIGGVFSGFLPGLGSANVAVLLLLIKNNITADFSDGIKKLKNFVVMTNAINISDTVFGITMLYFIARSRSGVSVALEKINIELSLYIFLMILGAMAVSAGLSFIAVTLSKNKVTDFFEKLNFKPLNLAIIVFLIFLVAAFCGVFGLVILTVATFIGLLAYYFDVRKSQLMGFFLVPTMLFFSQKEAEIVSFLHLEARTGYLEDISILKIVLIFTAAVILAIFSYFLSGKIWRNNEENNINRDEKITYKGRIKMNTVEIILPCLVIFIGIFLLAYSRIDHQKQLHLKRVIDGDTMIFYESVANKEIKCRLLAVDTPEKNPSEKLEKLVKKGKVEREKIIEAGKLASEFSRQWLEKNKKIIVSFHGRDKYKRHLCIVFNDKQESLNEAIIKNGYGIVYVGSELRKFNEELLALQNLADRENLGLWKKYSQVLEMMKK